MCTKGVSLYNILLQYGFAVSAPCGGNGKCGKCLLPVYGAFRKPYGEISTKQEIPACKAYPCGDCSVWISDFSDKIPVVNFPETKYDGESLGIAFDIGTTSICALLCDMSTGEELNSITCKNKQSSPTTSRCASAFKRQHFIQRPQTLLFFKIYGRLCLSIQRNRNSKTY